MLNSTYGIELFFPIYFPNIHFFNEYVSFVWFLYTFSWYFCTSDCYIWKCNGVVLWCWHVRIVCRPSSSHKPFYRSLDLYPVSERKYFCNHTKNSDTSGAKERLQAAVLIITSHHRQMHARKAMATRWCLPEQNLQLILSLRLKSRASNAS